MSKDTNRLNVHRRRLLAAAGAAGIAGVGFGRTQASVSGHSPDYAGATYAASNGPRLRVAWYSTYNGERQSASPTDGEAWDHEAIGRYVDGVEEALTGPVIDVPNLLPGDAGTLSVGLLVEGAGERPGGSDDDWADGGWDRAGESDDPTSGIGGDDRRANDASPDDERSVESSPTEGPPTSVWLRRRLSDGGLADAVDVELWYDDGLFGVGGCRGAEAGRYGRPIVEGTLANPETVPDANGTFEEGFELDPGLFDSSCLAPGDRLCLGFSWSVPRGIGNEYQGAATTFALDFRAVDCEQSSATGNPFEVVG